MNAFMHWVADRLVMSKANSAFNAERAKLGLVKPAVGEEGYPKNLLSVYLHFSLRRRRLSFRGKV
jgi:hypothetical protein